MKLYFCRSEVHPNCKIGRVYKEDYILDNQTKLTVKNDVESDNLGSWVIYQPDPESYVSESPKLADRFNSDKPRLSLLDLKCLTPGAKILEFGMKKYSRDNWKKGLVLSEVLDSMMRHIAALQDGEWNDPESGLSHIGHIQCNAMFLGCKNNIIDLNFNDGELPNNN